MQAAAIVLALAAVGGLTLAVIRLRGAPWPPLWMALGHGAVAATGVGLLIYAAVSTGIPDSGQVALGSSSWPRWVAPSCCWASICAARRCRFRSCSATA